MLKDNGSHTDVFSFFFSPAIVAALLLVSTCACLLPATHPNLSLSQSLSPGHICTFELIHIFCLFYQVFCSLNCHISNYTCLLYFSSPDDSWLSWREVAVPNPYCIKVSGTNATEELCFGSHHYRPHHCKPAAVCVELRFLSAAKTFDRWMYNVQAIPHK